MTQSLEIEFKNLLTEQEYISLKAFFKLESFSPIKQTNIYFDTKNLDLRKHGFALRVRVKNDHYELTLKQKANVGLLETTDLLELHEFNSLLTNHIIPQKTVFRQLQMLNINEIVEIAHLTTFRIEFPYLNQLIALDRSEYYNHVDYEMELETNDFNEGKRIYDNILKENHIPIRDTISKIQRATEYKIKKGY